MVLDLRADAGRAILAMAPAGSIPSPELASTTGTADATAPTSKPDDDAEMAFKKKPRTPGSGTAAGPGRGHDDVAGGPTADGAAGDMSLGGSSTPVGEGRGIRFVAVRGVFPYEKQLKKLADALHLDFDHQAVDYLEFADFVIERQRAIAGPNPWDDAKWEPLLLESAMEVLMQSDGLALDVLDADYTSQIFTMPLPSLVEMEWRPSLANHPLLKKFQLEVEDQLARAKVDEAVLEKFKEDGNKIKTRGGGFAKAQLDMRGIRQSVLQPSRGSGMGAMPGMGGMGAMPGMSGMSGRSGMSGMPNPMNMASPSGMPNPMANQGPASGHGGTQAAADLMNRMGDPGGAVGQRLQLNVMPRYLLFRYLDFDVEPGEAYRYRVQLVIRNPNFEREVELVEKPSIVEGETRFTEWSQPSPPVAIDTDVQYFLSQVVKKTVRARNEVEWNIFQWAQKEGTFLNEKLKVTLGQFIGGKAETLVLNPAAPSFKKQKDVPFHSDDLLVDSYGSAGVNLVPADHPDLNFNVKATAKSATLNIPDQAIVVNRFGELIAFDASSSKPAELAVSGRVKRERDAFDYLLNQPVEDATGADGGGLDAFINKQKSGTAGGKSGDKKSKKKQSNPIDARGAMMGGMMGGMMPPGGGGGGHAEETGAKNKKSKKGGGK
ncbi:MAG: hypothetical protein HZA46_02480 [Planctomycetales bacterium]|nr:hypothetical protein [Planctomycetales bacterium]